MNDLRTLLFLLLLLSLEMMLLTALLLAIFLRRIQFLVKTFFSEKIKLKISDKLQNCLENKKKFRTKWIVYAQPELLSCLEVINHRIKGENWEIFKKDVVSLYLLKRARRWARSFFWTKRNFAARVFALVPLKQDEPLILSLMGDSEFLVRGIASLAGVQLESKKGVAKVLSYMSQAKGYPYYFYRDILLQGSGPVFSFLAELIEKSRDPEIHLAGLSVFSGRTVPFPLSFLEKDLQSKNKTIRLLAFKALIRNPNEGALKVFLEALEDKESEIRIQCILGIDSLTDKEGLIEIKNALQDKEWVVRLQAAETLKKRGEILFLKTQEVKTDRLAYEVAQYALEFDQ